MKLKDKLKNGSSWGTSLKVLPWDKNDQITDTQQLISSTIHEWYDAKHPIASNDEIQLINKFGKLSCPYCHSKEIVKNGFYKTKIQRYYCKSCGKKFSPLTNTIFEAKKIPISEWIEYLIHLFEFHSIRTSARDNRNSESTGKYWLIKVFEVLKDIQNDVILEGNIYLDEMYFPVIKSKAVTKNGKKLRGISRNKIGVGVALITTATMGIKFLMASTEERSEIKRAMVPYAIGIAVIFGALTIWKVLIQVFESGL